MAIRNIEQSAQGPHRRAFLEIFENIPDPTLGASEVHVRLNRVSGGYEVSILSDGAPIQSNVNDFGTEEFIDVTTIADKELSTPKTPVSRANRDRWGERMTAIWLGERYEFINIGSDGSEVVITGTVDETEGKLVVRRSNQ